MSLADLLALVAVLLFILALPFALASIIIMTFRPF